MGPVAANTLSPALFSSVFIFLCLPHLLSLLLQNSALNLEKQRRTPLRTAEDTGAELLPWTQGCKSSGKALESTRDQMFTRGMDQNLQKARQRLLSGVDCREIQLCEDLRGNDARSLSFVFLEHPLLEYLGISPARQHKEIYFRKAHIKKYFKWPNCRTKHSGNTAGALVSL